MSSGCLDRREFARRIAAGLAGMPLIAESATAQQPPPASPPREPARDGDRERRADPPDEAKLLLAVVRRRYADERLDGAVLAGIEGELRQHLRQGELLARAGLTNSDEPAFVFAAYRADG
ncbi:MAG: hypothetical protein WD069_08000 [Planctomycetales bacterium]